MGEGKVNSNDTDANSAKEINKKTKKQRSCNNNKANNSIVSKNINNNENNSKISTNAGSSSNGIYTNCTLLGESHQTQKKTDGGGDEHVAAAENNQNIEPKVKRAKVDEVNGEQKISLPPVLQPTPKKEYKLRIVPLEKLLANPIQKIETDRQEETAKTKEIESTSRSALDRKSRCKISIIELSDSESEHSNRTASSSTKERIILKGSTVSRSSSKATRVPNETSKKCSISEKSTKQSSTIGTKIKLDKAADISTVNATKRTDFKKCVVRVKRTRLADLTFVTSTTNHTKVKKTNNCKKMEKYASSSASSSTSSSKSVAVSGKTTPAMKKRQRIASNSDSDSDFEVNKRKEVQTVDSDSDSVVADAAEIVAANEEVEAEEEEEAASSDSEVMPQRKRRVFGTKKKSTSSANDSDFEPEEKQKRKRRRRIRKNKSDESDDGDDDEKNKNKRKHIRKILKSKDLDISTQNAGKEEEDRRKRIEERQKLYNQIFEKPDNVEITELVLDFDEKSKKPSLEVDKGLLKKLKPHQVAGVKFMWDACFETLKDTDEKPGSGCILAHCMGLGKTLQVVTLSHTLLSNAQRTSVERVLIISPLSTLNNWAREYVYWMGFARKKDIEVYDISRFKDKPTRIFKLNEWYEEGGVCILGYDMYRILANEKAKGLRKKQREQLQKSLVEPGPDLVICDEGHLLKNEKTSISKAVTQMRTKRRIVLTGTPLQNNLKEYYCMIQFIKPNLLGTYKEYLNRFVNPITNGQYTDSTERDIRLMKHRSHILHKMLEGCIQRRDYSVLAPYLPPKHEYVVYTTLSTLQQLLYEFYMTQQRDLSTSDMGGKGARLFQDFQDLRRIWTHPMNLRVNSDNVIAKRLMNNDESDLDDFICDESESEAASNNSSSSSISFKSDISHDGGGVNVGPIKGKQRKTRNGRGGVEDESELEELSTGPPMQKDDPSEWWKRFVADKELNNINHSPKLFILMRLLQQCEQIGDKLLVFSQSLQSLDVIEHFLSLIHSNTLGYEFEGDIGDLKGQWKLGEDYFRLDGSCTVEQREAMCKKFNNSDNLQARLFLISTRAGGLGINLVAANRVVIFDVSWNPSHDTQSIFRVYRFGQIKPCYIYRLIAMGTMEQKVYERQVAKQATAKRVIDEQQISRHYNQTDLLELYTYELKPVGEREVPILPKDRLFAELLNKHEDLIFKYHEHDSLLENEESENLSESERKAAWAEYEAEKTRTVQTSQYMSYDRGAFGATVAAQFGNASGSVTSNKIFGFRSDVLLQLLNMKIAKDHPELSQNQVIQLVPAYLQQLYTEMNNGDPTMYKDLLQLHATIAHPSGMYMNPLLYANQNPSAAGYFQQPQQPQPPGGPVTAQPTQAQTASTGGFNPNEVYEID